MYLTAANQYEVKVLSKLVKRFGGKLFGEMAYLSKPLFQQHRQQGIHLITKLKPNMKNQLMVMIDKLLLRKRVIEDACYP